MDAQSESATDSLNSDVQSISIMDETEYSNTPSYVSENSSSDIARLCGRCHNAISSDSTGDRSNSTDEQRKSFRPVIYLESKRCEQFETSCAADDSGRNSTITELWILEFERFARKLFGEYNVRIIEYTDNFPIMVKIFTKSKRKHSISVFSTRDFIRDILFMDSTMTTRYLTYDDRNHILPMVIPLQRKRRHLILYDSSDLHALRNLITSMHNSAVIEKEDNTRRIIFNHILSSSVMNTNSTRLIIMIKMLYPEQSNETIMRLLLGELTKQCTCNETVVDLILNDFRKNRNVAFERRKNNVMQEMIAKTKSALAAYNVVVNALIR